MTVPGPLPDILRLDSRAEPVVRLYAMTRGRTQPTRGTFDLITIVVATPDGRSDAGDLGPEHGAVIQQCRRPTSVAEISSRLDLPVGVVRVLLGDLLERSLIRARPPQPTVHIPSAFVFKAVLDGLRSL
jgi:hypothetical protein